MEPTEREREREKEGKKEMKFKFHLGSINRGGNFSFPVVINEIDISKDSSGNCISSGRSRV